MGVYSNSRLSYGQSYDVQPAEGYEGVYGAQIAMIESCQNELAIFEATIRNDFQEAYLVVESASESEIAAFTEGTISDMFTAIKNFLKKIWEKIKGIFHQFMIKIDRVFMKSNKEFVEKYKKEILRKDLSDMEVKGLKPKGNYSSMIHPFPDTVENIDNLTNIPDNFDSDDIKEMIKKYDSDARDKVICDILNKTTNPNLHLSESKDYEKDAIEELFDNDTHDKFDINDIMVDMLNFKDEKKGIIKSNSSLEKAIKEFIKSIDNKENEFIKNSPAKDDTDIQNKHVSKISHDSEIGFERDSTNKWDAHALQLNSISNPKQREYQSKSDFERDHAIIRLLQMRASDMQTAATKYTALNIKVVNMINNWNRKVWAAAASYKKKEEDASLLEAWYDYAEFTAE